MHIAHSLWERLQERRQSVGVGLGLGLVIPLAGLLNLASLGTVAEAYGVVTASRAFEVQHVGHPVGGGLQVSVGEQGQTAAAHVARAYRFQA